MKTLDELAKKYLLKRFPIYEKDSSVMHIDIEIYKAGYLQGKADAIEAAVKIVSSYSYGEPLSAIGMDLTEKIQKLKSDTPSSGGDISFPKEHGNGGDVVDLNKLMRKEMGLDK